MTGLWIVGTAPLADQRPGGGDRRRIGGSLHLGAGYKNIPDVDGERQHHRNQEGRKNMEKPRYMMEK